MDYERLINRLTNRRDYFKSVDFQQHAGDLDSAIEAIKALLEENTKLKEVQKEKNKGVI